MDVIKTLVYEGAEPQDGEIYSIESIKRKNKRVICKLIKENSDHLKDASPVVYLLYQLSTDETFETIWNKKHQNNKLKVKSVHSVYTRYLNGTLRISFREKAFKKSKPIIREIAVATKISHQP